MSDFNIGEALTAYLADSQSIRTPDADPGLVDCENDPEAFAPGLINNVLNGISEAIGESPEAILEPSNLDSLQFLLKQSSHIPASSLSRILELLISALNAETDVAHQEQQDAEADLTQHRQVLEVYAFLLQWCVTAVDMKSMEKPTVLARGRGAKGGRSKGATQQQDGNRDPSALLQSALDTMSKVMKLRLLKFFVTTSERDTFVGLFTRPTYLLLENEVRVKSATIRSYSFRVLCIAVKHHGHAHGARTSVIQSLTYYEHLAEPMAEFVNVLAEQYDFPQLAEEVMRELANREFSANDTKGPKSVSTFVTHLSELAPRVVQRQVVSLAKLLESENYALRCAIIEVCGNLIIMLSNLDEGERRDEHTGQIETFFDVLEEHILDVNHYCRSRVLQVYVKLWNLDTKHRTRRQSAAILTAQSLEDKSSNVRRNAVKLLAKMMETHPFSAMHGGKLNLSEWRQRLDACEKELEKRIPSAEGDGVEQTVDSSLLDEATRMDAAEEEPQSEEELAAAFRKFQEEKANAEAIDNLKLTRQYYSEAITFIEILHEASAKIMQLLSSKNKNEVIDAMDFLENADAFSIETARQGIKRMMRLIWTKGNSDEGKGIQTHLIDCYKRLFFTAPTNFNPNEAAKFVARNMMSLTYGCSSAELTSLEQLLSTMMKGNLVVNELVIQKLWAVYGNQKKESSRQQRRGAIIVLGMLALADPDIVVREMETCLRIGLGNMGRRDLVLARYTCIALKRMTDIKVTKGTEGKPSTRLPNDHAVLVRLAGLLEIEGDNKDWYGMAEQAIGAIFSLSKHPEELSSDIIKRKTKFVFARNNSSSSQTRQVDSDEMDVDEDVEMSGVMEGEKSRTNSVEPPTHDAGNSALALARLLFTVGHVALKQIVHLELCEQDFKRRRAEKEKTTANATPPRRTPGPQDARANKEADDELDLITGSTEDDFADTIAYVREHELLHGEKSILLQFGPMATEICSNNTSYPNAELQAQAALCMAKFMCVSSRYCEANLDLLITVLERSPSSIIRSNLVVALGDMAVCFNHLIDENTDWLYRRLRDDSLQVKRTCLMTLTFLILAGQVKVKGQLGEMAKCAEDEDDSIRDLSRMFFAELAGKDNAIYNHFIDMFSLLSADEELEEDKFRRIVKFLASFIEKDKHAKQLAAKLAARLQRAESERQWNDVAFALGLLPHKSEDIAKQIAEGCKVVETGA